MSQKRDTVELSVLKQKDPKDWSVSEVGMWLQFIGLGEYRIKFIEDCISGGELLTLSNEDLISLNVTVLGHRKKLLKGISELKTGNTRIDFEQGSDTSVGRADAAPSMSVAPGRIAIKCYYKGDVHVLTVKDSISLEKFKSKIKEEFGHRMTFKVKDDDGDMIDIKTDKDLNRLLKNTKPPIRLYCERYSRSDRSTPKSTQTISEAETGVLETLLEGIIIIDTKGTVLFFNKSAEKLWSIDRSEILARNIKNLMPISYATQHDGFLENYLKTGKAKIIGSGRSVLAKRLDGSSFPIHLSVSESKTADRHTFTGTVRLATITPSAAGSSSSTSQFAVLDSLLEMAIVINEQGTVLFFNQVASRFFGFSPEEIVGKNINFLMPSPHKENHDYYLRNYVNTGEKKVIGKSRDVICQLKDGTILPINLSVTEQKQPDGSRVFTGLIRQNKIESTAAKSLLQQDREVLNSLLVPGIIIDSTGIIQAFNTAAHKLLGYTLDEVLGQNINMLVAAPHREKHDQYIQNYLTTRIAKVIGKERDVIAQHKSGGLIRVRLSVTERRDGAKVFFTGMLHSTT